jgi:GNAT superfamily N-acetyltransferase
MRSPKPFPSLIDHLGEPSLVRLCAHDGRAVIGVATITDDGRLWVAVSEEHRQRGVGRRLITAAVERARVTGHRRLVLTSSHRSGAVAALAADLGWIVVDQGRGRIDLIIDLTVGLTGRARSA